MISSGTYQAADALLVDAAGRLLMMLRDDIPTIPWPNCWDLPGGVLEAEESIEAAALREIREECGYQAEGLQPFAVYDVPNGLGASCECHVLCGRIDAPLSQLRLSPDEGQALRFFGPGDIDSLRMVWDGRIVREFFASPQYHAMIDNGRR